MFCDTLFCSAVIDCKGKVTLLYVRQVPMKDVADGYNKAHICKRLWSPGIDSEESISPAYVVWRARARICKRLWSPGIDSEESISPTYVAGRAGTKKRGSRTVPPGWKSIPGFPKRSANRGSVH